MSWNPKTGFRFKGLAEVEGMQLKHPEWPDGGADVVAGFDGRYKVGQDGQREIELNQVGVSLNSEGRLLGEMNATGEVLLGLEEAQGEIQAKRVDLKQLKLTGVVPSIVRLGGGRKWKEGVLDYEGGLKWSPGEALALNGRLKAKGLKVDMANWPGELVDMSLSGPVVLRPDRTDWGMLDSGDLNGSIVVGERLVGEFGLESAAPGKHTLRLRGFDVSLIQLAEPVWPQSRSVVAGQGKADIDMSWNPKTGFRFKGVAEVKDWVARNKREELSQPITASVVFDISHRDEKLTIHECIADLGRSKLADNKVEIMGEYDFSHPDKITGKIVVQSDEVEVMRVFNAIRAEPELPQPSGRSLEVDMVLKAGRLHWRGAIAIDSNATVSIADRITKFRSIQMYWKGEGGKPNGGRLGAIYTLDRSRPDWAHDLLISCRGVSPNVLFNIFDAVPVPGTPIWQFLEEQDVGVMDADLAIKWIRVPGSKLDRSKVTVGGLHKTIPYAKLEIKRASIDVADQAGSPIARIIKYIDDGVSSFVERLWDIIPTAKNKGKLDRSQNKVNDVSSVFRLEGNKLHHLRSVIKTLYYTAIIGEFMVEMPDRLPDIPFDRLPVEVTLSEELARKYRLGGWLRNKGPWTLPKFMWINGKLGDPRVEVNQQLRNEIVAGWAANKVINVPADVLEKTSGVINILPLPNPLRFIFPRKK